MRGTRRILFATRLPKCVMFGEPVRGAVSSGGRKRCGWGCLLDDLRAFGIKTDQWTIAAQDADEWCKTVNKGADFFMKNWIASDGARAALRHEVVSPNVKGPK